MPRSKWFALIRRVAADYAADLRAVTWRIVFLYAAGYVGAVVGVAGVREILLKWLMFFTVAFIAQEIFEKRGLYKMSEGNLVDKLLKMDAAKITELPTKEIEIKRLSKILGEPFLIKCRAISGEKYTEIQKMGVSYNKKGALKDLDIAKTKVLTLIDGIVEPNLKRKDLSEKFGAVTPKELIYKLFLAGEIDEIYGTITDLCGYEDRDDEEETDEEIKN